MLGQTCNSVLPRTRGVPTSLCTSPGRTHRRLTNQTRPLMVSAAASASTSEAAMQVDSSVKRMRLKSLRDCELGVSVYPVFAYDASTGGGWADVELVAGQQGLLKVVFDPQAVIIPDLYWRTASLFKVPIPPPLRIAITTQRLEGTVNTLTGEVLLNFDAEFIFSAGPLYSAPPLVVRTLLTTGQTKGRFREGTGTPFVNAKGKLAGTAQVEKTGDLFMDTFLMLPTDALAIMSAELEFE